MASSAGSCIQGPVRDYPSTPVPRLFTQLLEENPEVRVKSAIIFNDIRLTFQDVHAISDDIAEALHSWLEPDRQATASTLAPKSVGLLVPDNHMRAVAILGIWKAAGAYTPLDTVLPMERIHGIVKETGIKVILYQTQQRGRMLASLPSDIGLIDLDTLSTDVKHTKKEHVDGLTKPSKRVSFSARHLAPVSLLNQNLVMCILTTSGSTGEPKFVPIKKNCLLNRLHWHWEDFPFQNDEVGCQKTPPFFVDHLFELFAFLLRGHPIVIIPRNVVQEPAVLLAELTRHQVTRLVLVPSLLTSIVCLLKKAELKSIPPLRMVFSEGEPLPPNLAMEFFNYFPGSLLINGYGCTETTANVAVEIYRSAHEIEYKSANGYLSIGKPLSNMAVFLLDDMLQPVKEGQIGLLFAAGKNVVDGYLKPNNICSSIFIQNPFSSHDCYPILYNTGDYALIQNSRLIYQGRKDATIKVRGQRVNLREVETAIERLKYVKSVVALPHHISQCVTNIVAFYQSNPCAHINYQDIYNHCKAILPQFMIPLLVQVDEVPTQPGSGKVDRVKLIEMYKGRLAGAVASEDELLSMDLPCQLTHIISEVAGLLPSAFSLNDNFFEIGGNSITALAVLNRLQDLGVQLSLLEFLRARNLREVCSQVANATSISEGLDTKYEVVNFNECIVKDDVVPFLARSFVEKDPLEIMAGTLLPSAEQMIQSLWPAVCKDDLSVVAVDKLSKRPVGAILNFDFRTDPDIFIHNNAIWLIIEAVKKPIKDKLLQTGEKWIDSSLAGCDVTLPDYVAPALVEMMELRVCELAKERGFDGIITVYSHPVTASIAENYIGYKVANTIHATSFKVDEHCPFSVADESYYLKCMLKRL